jgi:hypothetical protein
MKGPRALLMLIAFVLAGAPLTACQPSTKTVVTVVVGTPAVTIQVVTATAAPTSTPVPPTAKPTLPPPTPIPTLALPTVKPTIKPTVRPTLKPTSPSVPPTARPPAAGQGDVTLTVVNTFSEGCRIVLWGPADVTMDAGPNGGTASRTIKPGTYGWKAFIGGATTGQADNMVARAGGRCQFLCDGPARAIRWGCN